MHSLRTRPGCNFSFGDSALYAEPKYKHHKLEVVTTDSKNRRWEVEVTVSWLEHRVEQRRKYGPYQGFESALDAQSWGIIRSIEWIDTEKAEPSAFIPLPAPLEQDLQSAWVVNRR